MSEGPSRRNNLGYVAAGGALLGGGLAADAVVDTDRRRRGLKGPIRSMSDRGRRAPGRVWAGTGVKTVSTGVKAAGIPLIAYGGYNLVRARKSPELTGREVAARAVRGATFVDAARAVRPEPMSKRDLTAAERSSISRHKRAGEALSLVGGGLGLTALGLRAPEAAKFVMRRRPGGRLMSRVAAREPGWTKASNAVGVTAIGTGAAGSFNYAAQQRAERKQFEKSLSLRMPEGQRWRTDRSEAGAAVRRASRDRWTSAANRDVVLTGTMLAAAPLAAPVVNRGLAAAERRGLTPPGLRVPETLRLPAAGRLMGLEALSQMGGLANARVVSAAPERRRGRWLRRALPDEAAPAVSRPLIGGARGRVLRFATNPKVLAAAALPVTVPMSVYAVRDARERKARFQRAKAGYSRVGKSRRFRTGFAFAGGAATAGSSLLAYQQGVSESRARRRDRRRQQAVRKREWTPRDRERAGLAAAGAAAGVAGTMLLPLPMRLPDDGGASERIEAALGRSGRGRVPIGDVRGVATGAGERFDAQRYQDRLSASMDDRRRRGLPALDPSRPIRIKRSKSGKMHIIDGHHRVQSLLDLGETHADVVVERGVRGYRTPVPLAFRGKYVRGVANARRVTPPRPIDEIRASAAEPMRRSAVIANNARSRFERGVTWLRRPRNAGVALAVSGVAGGGGWLASRRAREGRVGKAMAGGETLPVSSMSEEQRRALREAVDRQRRTRLENPARFKGSRPLHERGVRADRPAGAADSYRRKARRARIDALHGQALSENAARDAARSALRPSRFVSPRQVARWGAGAGVAGAGLGLLAARAADRSRGGSPAGGDGVDIAAGALAGLGARDAVWGSGGWAAKRGIGAYRERAISRMDPAERAAVNQAWKDFQRAEGFKQFGRRLPGDRVDMTRHGTQVSVGRRYPLSIPGGRGMRALAWKNHWALSHGSRVAAPVAGAALVAHALRSSPVEKAMLAPRRVLAGGGFRRPSMRSSYVGVSRLGRKFTVRGSVG